MKGVMSFRKWKDKLNNMNERSHELLKNKMYMKGPLRNTNERTSKLLKIKGHVVQNKLKVLWSDLFLRINWAIQMKGLISF